MIVNSWDFGLLEAQLVCISRLAVYATLLHRADVTCENNWDLHWISQGGCYNCLTKVSCFASRFKAFIVTMQT